MQFLCSIWKILHLTEYFYTGTAHDAHNNYQVCDDDDNHDDDDDDNLVRCEAGESVPTEELASRAVPKEGRHL